MILYYILYYIIYYIILYLYYIYYIYIIICKVITGDVIPAYFPSEDSQHTSPAYFQGKYAGAECPPTRPNILLESLHSRVVLARSVRWCGEYCHACVFLFTSSMPGTSQALASTIRTWWSTVRVHHSATSPASLLAQASTSYTACSPNDGSWNYEPQVDQALPGPSETPSYSSHHRASPHGERSNTP